MNLYELSLLYGLVGASVAVALLLVRHKARALSSGVWIDALLLLLFWPLHGPFLLLAGAGSSEEELPMSDSSSEPSDKHGLLQALRRAEGTPLASLLPDAKTGSMLARRLDDARAKVDEIDALLLQPDFSEDAAHARHDELVEQGDRRAAAAAKGRMQHIQRLRSLRDRYERELNEVGGLIAHLRIQAAVVRLAGADDDTRDLIGELMHRIEGLDAVLDA